MFTVGISFPVSAVRYPFVLSKCSMYSVGAPHTWPQALGALMWLIDNVKVRNKQQLNKSLFLFLVNEFKSVLCLLCVSSPQIKWSLSKQELLFSDFCEDSDNIEEGPEYNKVY